MTSLTTSNNIQNLKVKEKCTVTDWDYLIYEGDGYFTKEDQFIVFDYDGLDFVVSFKLSVSVISCISMVIGGMILILRLE